MPRLDTTAWVRIAAVALAALALLASAIEIGGVREEQAVALSASITALSPLAAELERCRTLRPESPRDEACNRAWAESRRRFLGNATTPSAPLGLELIPSQPAPAQTGPTPPTVNP